MPDVAVVEVPCPLCCYMQPVAESQILKCVGCGASGFACCMVAHGEGAICPTCLELIENPEPLPEVIDAEGQEMFDYAEGEPCESS